MVVASRDFLRLRLPVRATGLGLGNAASLRTPFTRAALLELLALLKECEDPCRSDREGSGPGSPNPCNRSAAPRSSPSSRRRSRSVADAVQPVPLLRLAVVYVRPSSPPQTLTNRESLKLQDNLQEHARAAGWDPSQLRTSDADLGRSGRTSQGRQGFPELVALVNQEPVGILFAYDVPRRARHGTDWYHRLDRGAFRTCRVGDQDGSYDPATPKGRLVLGLKGLISALELPTLRARLTAGRVNQAQPGALARTLPVGLVRDSLGRVFKHPDQEVQNRLGLVFPTFLPVKAACQVVRFVNAHDRLLPRKDRFGDGVWRKPTVPALRGVLKNPASAGAFVYGRPRAVPRAGAPPARVQPPLPPRAGKGAGTARTRGPVPPLPPRAGKVCPKDRYPASLDGGPFERIQARVHDNHRAYDRNKTRGVPRRGQALLHGIVSCGECGPKRVVQDQGRTPYLCHSLRQQYQVPVCQNLPAAPMDPPVVAAFLEALSPVAGDLSTQAVAALRQEVQPVRPAQPQQRQRLRSQARWAERPVNQADPDNRLVAAERERRWQAALRERQDAEERFRHEAEQPSAAATLRPADREAFVRAGPKIPPLGRQGLRSPPQQKAFGRCLIDQVVVPRCAPDMLQVRIVWRGGATTTAALAVSVGSLARLSSSLKREKEILELAKKGKTDQESAAVLTQRGHRSPKHPTVLPSTVRIIRLRQRLFRERHHAHPRHIPGCRTVPQLVRALKSTPPWIYDRIHKGTIRIARDSATNLYLFPDRAETITLFKQRRAGKLQKLRC